MDMEDPEDTLQICLSVLTTLTIDAEELESAMPNCRLDQWIESLLVQASERQQQEQQPLQQSGILQPWNEQWKRMGTVVPQMTPFALHALATAAGLQLTESMDTSDENDDPTNSSISALVLQVLTLLMLCIHALQQCPVNPPKFRKRWKSFLFETIRLYQRYLWLVIIHQNNNDYVLHSRLVQNGICPWVCETFLPLIQHTLQKLTNNPQSSPMDSSVLLSSENPEYFHWTVVTTAACVQIISHWIARLTTTCMAQDSNTEDSFNRIQPFLACLANIGHWEWLARHAERCHQHPTLTLRQHAEYSSIVPGQQEQGSSTTARDSQVSVAESFETALAYWSCWRERPVMTMLDDDTNNHDFDEDEDEILNDIAESVCFVDTVWNKVGISIALAASWEIIDTIWSPVERWKWLFPHVPILLEGSDDEEEHFITQMKDYDTPVRQWGFSLLHRLLTATPDQSIPLQDLSTTLNPTMPLVKVFQLLINHVLIMNTLLSVTQQHGPAADSIALSLPSASQTFVWMKQLLAKHHPVSSQVAVVQHLVDTCPHEGLKPKLVDLLRPLVIAGSLNEVFAYVDQSWGDILDNRFPTTTSDDFEEGQKDSSNNDSCWVRLIQSTELAVAVLSLVELGYRLHHDQKMNTYTFARLNIQSLEQLHSKLRRKLRQWMTSSTTGGATPQRPKESFRLNLLESALAQLLQLMKPVGNH